MQKLNLLENALDSFEHAIDHLTSSNLEKTGDFKRVINDLSDVAELLFKERLCRIHPAFILSKVDDYPSTNVHTVSASKALQRLQKIGNVDFEKSDISALKIIREKRNQIEHYEFSINEKESKIVIGNVLVFLFRFSSDELGLDWAERRLNDKSWRKLNEYTEFYEVQRSLILDTLFDSGIPTVVCPICKNDTFDLDSEICLLCGHKEEVMQCKVCKSDYLCSDVDYEDAELCLKCEWEDGYASAHYEKY